jgi:hypothetical protein
LGARRATTWFRIWGFALHPKRGGNYQIASITVLSLLVPSIVFMLVVETFLKADVLETVER